MSLNPFSLLSQLKEKIKISNQIITVFFITLAVYENLEANTAL